MFTAAALSLFVVELALPSLPMFPFIKIGLANTVTLFVLYLGGSWRFSDCAAVLFLRILLGAFVTGQLMAVMFSAVGGLFALFSMYAGKKFFRNRAIPLVSVFGALAHNLGQMTVAVFVYGGFSLAYYVPVLIIGGIAGGLVTGFAVFAVNKGLDRFLIKIKDV